MEDAIEVSSSPIRAETEEPETLSVREHPLSSTDLRSLDLPALNWGFCKMREKYLVIFEMFMIPGTKFPRVRKHIVMNLSSGVCTSYVMEHKISHMQAVTTLDVEHCIEELHMMHACVGGPPAWKLPTITSKNSRVDGFGNWRHNSCKIVSSRKDSPCGACQTLDQELAQKVRDAERRTSNCPPPKKLKISDLSHRKQSQIIALRKRQQSWHRKRKIAEKEVELIEELISEVTQEPNGNTDDEEAD